MITRKATAIAASAILLLVGGLVFRNSYLMAASAPLLVFLAVARIIDEEPHIEVAVRQSGPAAQVYEGEESEMEVVISNRGESLPVFEAVDVMGEGLEVSSGSNRAVVPLKEGEQVKLRFAVSPRVFGVHRVGPVKVRALSSMGVFAAAATFNQFIDIKVYPKVQYASRIDLRLAVARNWPGEILTNRPWEGMEFYGIREYYSTDRLRRINWKASSRSDDLLSNQYRGEFGGDTMIVLDARAQSELGTPPESVFTYSVRAAALVAYHLVRGRNRVGLLAFGGRLVKVNPGFGRRQFDRILTTLIEVKPGRTWDFDFVPKYLDIFYSRLNQIVVVSPLMDGKSSQAIADLAAKGYPLHVISPSPIEVEMKGKKPDKYDSVAEGLARLEREAKLSALRRHAVVIDWNTETQLASALRKGAPMPVVRR